MSVLWNFLMNNADAIGVIIGFVSLMVPIIWRASKRIQKVNDRRMKEFKDYVRSEIAASEARLKDHVQSEIKSENAASEARIKDYVQSEIKSEIAASEARLKEFFHAEISGVYSKIGEVDANLSELDLKVGETVAVMKTKFEEIDRNISEVKNDVRAVWQPLINAFLMQKPFRRNSE